MAKTTNIAKFMIEKHQNLMMHYSEKVESHPEDSDYYIGLARGASIMLEFLLHEQGCYHGFSYMNNNMEHTVPDNSDYRDWRIRFCSR